MAIETHDAGADSAPGDAVPGRQAEDTDRFPALAQYFLWADNPAAVQRLILGLAVVCAILLGLDIVIHRHAEVPGEGVPGFYPFVGLVSFTLIVLGARLLRTLIRRDERFYAPNGVDAEAYPLAGTDRQTLDTAASGNATGRAETGSGAAVSGPSGVGH